MNSPLNLCYVFLVSFGVYLNKTNSNNQIDINIHLYVLLLY